MVEQKDIITLTLSDEKIKTCINTAEHITKSIIDRSDLHTRDYLERFINVLMGEIAETLVITWLLQNKKYVESAVDKDSDEPDLGHDLWLKTIKGDKIKCSVKSSLSAFKGPEDILKNFTIATKESEVRDVNIQVYFWLDLRPQNGSRITLPSSNNCAIMCWCGINDLTNFNHYNTEKRQTAVNKLQDLRSMETLLDFIS